MMIGSKFKFYRKSALLLSLFIVVFSSCSKKDNEPNPDYVGTWVALQTITQDGETMQFKDIMTFTKDGFNDRGQVYDVSTSKYIDYVKLNGTMTISGAVMNISITEIGVSSVDPISGAPTGIIVMYKEGTSQYDLIFSQTGQPKTFISEFSVDGPILTLKTDNNDDGDYTDINETTFYTKQ
jgi:hypothetical protein